MSRRYRVSEIFHSIDGEGKRAGTLASFIRLTGCNLRCSYCDTRYAYDGGEIMTAEDIVKQLRCKNVTLTGGEPLAQEPFELLSVLGRYSVNIETNGSIDISEYMKFPNVFFTMDFKCGSSGETEKMHFGNLELLREYDVLKFVVGSDADLCQAMSITRQYKIKAAVYVSPVFGGITPAEIVNFMQENDLEDWRLQLQLHKIIWSPNERGV